MSLKRCDEAVAQSEEATREDVAQQIVMKIMEDYGFFSVNYAETGPLEVSFTCTLYGHPEAVVEEVIRVSGRGIEEAVHRVRTKGGITCTFNSLRECVEYIKKDSGNAEMDQQILGGKGH